MAHIPTEETLCQADNPESNQVRALLSIGLKSEAELHPDYAAGDTEYDGSVAISEKIIAAGVILFCVCLTVCAVLLALTAHVQPNAPRRQSSATANSVGPRLQRIPDWVFEMRQRGFEQTERQYVVQSGFVEIVPK